MVCTLKNYLCYSAGPRLFPRDLPDGRRESWEEAQARVRAQDTVIAKVPFFDVITPTNASLEPFEVADRPKVCMQKDLLFATKSDIVFADMTPFGGREPDSGTVVEATACALAGGLLVLWADPLTTFAEKYADADVHPDSELDLHYNLMIEQLYYWSWQRHFGMTLPVFDGLTKAVDVTQHACAIHGLTRISLLDKILETGERFNLDASATTILPIP